MPKTEAERLAKAEKDIAVLLSQSASTREDIKRIEGKVDMLIEFHITKRNGGEKVQDRTTDRLVAIVEKIVLAVIALLGGVIGGKYWGN